MSEVEDPAAFSHVITVGADDIDELGHVNNAVYLRYVDDVARAHASRQGLELEDFVAAGALPVVRRHVVDYLRPAVRGDRLRVSTRVRALSGVRGVRDNEVRRVSDDALLVEAETLWAWLDPATLRPKRIPAAILRAFGYDGAERDTATGED